MNIATLENTNLPVIATAFNRAFDQYFVPVQLSEEGLQHKIETESINLAFSPAAFENGDVAGFILHGIRELDGKYIAYNAGTGVLSNARGRHLTREMYEYILQELQYAGVTSVILEVIVENASAIAAYERIGFAKGRLLKSFKGKIYQETVKEIAIKELEYPEWQELQQWHEWKPTWQHSRESIISSRGRYKMWGAYLREEFCGYIAIDMRSGRLAQLAIKPEMRRKGIATTLMQYFSDQLEDGITIINVDAEAEGTLKFIEKLNLKPLLEQYEMTMMLSGK